MRSLDRALDGAAAVYVASAASVIIACVFIFVWAPHPWGWEGFDHYHDLGRLLARGEPFPTTDVPWGYAYFLAPFYRVFGDRPWIPLLAQAALNGLVPILLYRLVSLELDRRTGAAAAILTGFFSFNTLYASTQSSDAVLCRVGRALRARAAVPPEPRDAATRAGRPVSSRQTCKAREDRSGARVSCGSSCYVGALDRSQLSFDRSVTSDEHARRHATVVRHVAGGTLPREPRLQSALGLRVLWVRLLERRRAPASRVGRSVFVRTVAGVDRVGVLD